MSSTSQLRYQDFIFLVLDTRIEEEVFPISKIESLMTGWGYQRE